MTTPSHPNFYTQELVNTASTGVDQMVGAQASPQQNQQLQPPNGSSTTSGNPEVAPTYQQYAGNMQHLRPKHYLVGESTYYAFQPTYTLSQNGGEYYSNVDHQNQSISPSFQMNTMALSENPNAGANPALAPQQQQQQQAQQAQRMYQYQQMQQQQQQQQQQHLDPYNTSKGIYAQTNTTKQPPLGTTGKRKFKSSSAQGGHLSENQSPIQQQQPQPPQPPQPLTNGVSTLLANGAAATYNTAQTMMYPQQSLVQMSYSPIAPTNGAQMYNMQGATHTQMLNLPVRTSGGLGSTGATNSPTISSSNRLSPHNSQHSRTSSSGTNQSEFPDVVRPKVATTYWEDEGTMCYQVRAKRILVSRREDTNYINGTKLLNVIGMTRGKRDGILKTEKTKVVVKVGSMNLKGVWIPFERAYEFARNEGVDELLYPLFVKDIKTYFREKGHKLKSENEDEELLPPGTKFQNGEDVMSDMDNPSQTTPSKNVFRQEYFDRSPNV